MGDRLTEEQLAALERLERGATPEPWRVGEDGGDYWFWSGAGDKPVSGNLNGNLLETARNALPALLAEVRAGRALLPRALTELEASIGCCGSKACRDPKLALIAELRAGGVEPAP